MELIVLAGGGALPESVSLPLRPEGLRDVTPRQRSIYRGTICLILGAAAARATSTLRR